MSGDLKQIAIAVVEHNDRLLVGRRPEGAVLAGMWEFPGGKVQPGETLEQGAVRECGEETGIEVTVVGRFPDCVHEYDYGTVHLHFFHCRPLSAEATNPRPPFCWVPRRELWRYEFPNANTEVLRMLSVTPAHRTR
jgi:A/G-specific adenine glycosylase